MNLPLNARMHSLANYTPGGAIRTDLRSDTIVLPGYRRVYFSLLSLSLSHFLIFFCFSIPVYVPEYRAREVEFAPICFHDNRKTVSTPPTRAAVTALFFFVFYWRNSVVIFMTIRRRRRCLPVAPACN